MASFPEYFTSETDKVADHNKWGKQWIDAIVDFDSSIEQRTRIERIQRNFDTFNGIHENKAKKFISNAYGAELSTSYDTFHIGRTKEKLLFGEFLDIGLKSTIESVNPDAVADKLSKRNFIAELMNAKPMIEAVKELTGMNVLNGMKIPDKGTPEAEAALKPKRKNEMVIQRIIDKKIEEDQLKMKFYQDFQHLVITSECHGIIETDTNGVDTYQTLNPKHVIFQESPGDPLCLRTPFDGYKKLFFKHEIYAMFPNLSDKDKERIKNMGSSEGDPNERNYTSQVDGQTAIWCYYCQWRSSRGVYIKEGQNKNSSEKSYYEIPTESYEKYQTGFQKRVEKNEFKISNYYKEDVWEGWRIGYGIYYGIQRQNNQIQKIVNGKARAYTTFVHCLFGTIDGKRISLEELITELADVHDLIMFIIKREIKKVKGKVYTYDERFLPANIGSMTKMMYDVVEHGIIRFNSTVENLQEDQIVNAANLIQSIDLGLTQSFGILLELKRDIESTIDKITGINEAREGYSAASSTATGARQNIEASRSITKDLFFMHQLYGSLVITKLAGRTKLNKKYLESQKGIFLNDDDLSFLNSIRDLAMDDFAGYLTDGHEYNEIKDFALQLFPQEINAQHLRTKDVIRFKASQSLAEGLEVLDNAWAELQQIEQQALQQKTQSEEADRQMKLKIAVGDREDWQAHEIQLQELKMKEKAGTAMVQGGIKGQLQTSNNRVNARSANGDQYPPPPDIPQLQQQQPQEEEQQMPEQQEQQIEPQQ